MKSIRCMVILALAGCLFSGIVSATGDNRASSRVIVFDSSELNPWDYGMSSIAGSIEFSEPLECCDFAADFCDEICQCGWTGYVCSPSGGGCRGACFCIICPV